MSLFTPPLHFSFSMSNKSIYINAGDLYAFALHSLDIASGRLIFLSLLMRLENFLDNAANRLRFQLT